MTDNVKIFEPTTAAPAGYEQTLSGAKQVGGANGPKMQRVVPTFEAASGTQTDVGAATPLPTVDTQLGALGTTVDVAAVSTTGARTAISLLKAIAAWALNPVLAPTEVHLGQVGGDVIAAVGSFSRPADTVAYITGDLIANSTTPGSVVPVEFIAARKSAGSGRVTRVRLVRAKPEFGAFRIHLYRTAPVVQAGSGDNNGYLTDNVAGYLGNFDVTTDRMFSDGAKGFGVANGGGLIAFDTAAGSQKLYGLLEARGAITPNSGETFTLTLEVDRD